MTSPSAYMAVVQNGAVVDSVSTPGVKVDPNEVPKTPPGGKYQIKDSFGNMKGTLLQVVFPVDLFKFGLKGTFNLVYIYNLTKQINAVDKYFSNQKRDTIIKLSVTGLIALILFSLLSTFWLRYLVNRYVRKPIDKLNTSAQQLAVGTFEGEVEVDPDSDFAALQGLLRSGQLILRQLDEKMDDKG